MRTIYTDRYAVAVWLPGLLGLAFLILWAAGAELGWKEILLGCFCLASAALAGFRRWRSPPDFSQVRGD